MHLHWTKCVFLYWECKTASYLQPCRGSRFNTAIRADHLVQLSSKSCLVDAALGTNPDLNHTQYYWSYCVLVQPRGSPSHHTNFPSCHSWMLAEVQYIMCQRKGVKREGCCLRTSETEVIILTCLDFIYLNPFPTTDISTEITAEDQWWKISFCLRFGK